MLPRTKVYKYLEIILKLLQKSRLPTMSIILIKTLSHLQQSRQQLLCLHFQIHFPFPSPLLSLQPLQWADRQVTFAFVSESLVSYKYLIAPRYPSIIQLCYFLLYHSNPLKLHSLATHLGFTQSQDAFLLIVIRSQGHPLPVCQIEERGNLHDKYPTLHKKAT